MLGSELLTIKEAVVKGNYSSPEDIADLMVEESGADRECMWVLHLNAQNEVLRKELVAMGTYSSLDTTASLVFRKAVIDGAPRIVVVHNHPSGDPTPSKEDLAIGKSLDAAGAILGIKVMDHIILGRGQGWSRNLKHKFKVERK